MAVDSRNKRMSMMGLGSPVPSVLPHPDGGVDTVFERAMLMFLYAGISLESTVRAIYTASLYCNPTPFFGGGVNVSPGVGLGCNPSPVKELNSG